MADAASTEALLMDVARADLASTAIVESLAIISMFDREMNRDGEPPRELWRGVFQRLDTLLAASLDALGDKQSNEDIKYEIYGVDRARSAS